MSVEKQLSEAAQKAADAAKAKARDFWKWAKTRGRLHAKVEWYRTQNRAFRKLRDLQEPPRVPKWLQRAIKGRQDGIVELPFKRDAEPFLLVRLSLQRPMEIQRGWLSGRVNGRNVRFRLSEEFKKELEFHDPTFMVEIEERIRQEQSALEKLSTGPEVPEESP